MNMKVICSLLVSIACTCAATNLVAKPATAEEGYYTTKDSEFYLSTEQLLFIRPGLEVEILDVVIPADLHTEVTFRLTDPEGLPLDRDGVTTPGPVWSRFMLAYIPAGEEAYLSYTSRIQTSPITGDSAQQATLDPVGTYTSLGNGTYMYKFGAAVPADYDQDATHTVAMLARRNLTEFDLGYYVSNELEHFVPSGLGDPVPREIVTTETCNGRCHDPLRIHGGTRRAIGLCILCHNPWQDIDPDTGNSVDMPLMVHKIHMGEKLTKGYNIIGYMQSNHDYSEVVYPAEITECESCHTGGTPTANFPMVATPAAALVCDATGNGKTTLSWEHTGDVAIYIRSETSPDGKLFATGNKTGSVEAGKWVSDGSAFDIYDFNSMELLQTIEVNTTVLGCVSTAPATPRGVAALQHTNWLDHPTRKTCGACHDYIDWETGEGHSDFDIAQPNDDDCGLCHLPGTGGEYDRTVKGSHIPHYKSAQLPGILIVILSVTDTDPGDHPTVKFSMTSKDQGLNPADLAFFRLIIAGNNDDYSFLAEEFATGAVRDGDDWSYTFSTPLPDDAEGSFTAGAEAFTMVQIETNSGPTMVRHTAENDVFTFAVTDDAPIARRMVVDDYKCESCHVNLALHGTIRHEAQYCATCHLPASTDIGQVQEGNEEQGIHFKYMVHKIHRGADLENGYVVAGFNQSIHDYSHFEYTGDLRNCDACHVNNSQQVPESEGLLPTATPQDWWDPTMPQAAACLSCHDDDSSAAHAYSNTTFFGESCATCHGEGKSEAVDKVHAH